MKPKWKAYLFCPGPPHSKLWDWHIFDNREQAISITRTNAQYVTEFYSNLNVGDPVEENLDNKGVLFRIPGISNYERWPRVEPINE